MSSGEESTKTDHKDETKNVDDEEFTRLNFECEENIKSSKLSSIQALNSFSHNSSTDILDPSDFEEPTFQSTLKKLSMSILTNSLWCLFNHSQVLIILYFLNRKYHNDEKLTSAVGTCHTLYYVLIYPMYSAFIEMIEIYGSQFLVSRNYDLFGHLLNKTRVFGYSFILLFTVIFVFLHNQILGIWSMKQDEIKLTEQLMYLCLLSIMLEFEFTLMLRYLNIKEKEHYALSIIILNGLFVILYCFIFISVFDLYSLGPGSVYVMYALVNAIAIWGVIYIFVYDNQVLIAPSWKMFNNMWTYFKTLGPLICVYVLEYISSEVASISANFYSREDFAIFTNVMALSLIVNFVESYKISSVILMSSTIAQRSNQEKQIALYCDRKERIQEHNTKKVFFYLIYISIICAALENITYFLFSDPLVSLIIVAQEETHKKILKMFRIAILNNFIESLYVVIHSSLKSLGHVNECLYLAGLYTITNIGCVYYFSFKTSLKIVGVFIGVLTNTTLNFVIVIIYYLVFVDFEKCTKEVNSNLEHYE